MSDSSKNSIRSNLRGCVTAHVFVCLAGLTLACFPALGEDLPKVVASPVSSFIGDPTISAVHRDSRGYLWIGTQQGLYQFDGSEVQYYSSSPASPIRLPFSYITGIAEHIEGGIVVSTYGGGLFKIDSGTGSIFPYKEDLLRNHKYIKRAFELPYGILLSSESGSAFVSFYSADVIDLGNSAIIGVVDNLVESSEPFDQRNILFGTAQGMFILDFKTGSYEQVFHIEAGNKITSLASKNSNSIYFTSDDNILRKYNHRSHLIESSIPLPVSASTHITEMQVFKEHVWVVSDEGLLGISKDLDRIRNFNTENSLLLNNHISVLESDNSQLWIGTYQGLNSLIFSPFHTHSKDEGNTFEDVLAFAERENGELYIGTYEGLYRYEETTRLHSKLEFMEVESGNSTSIISLSANSNRLLIGTWRSGLHAMDFSNGRFYPVPLPKNSELAITSVTQIEDSSVWVSTYNNGIYLLDQELNYRGHYLSNQSVLALSVAPLGQVIVASKEHIFIYSPKTEEFKRTGIVFEGLERFPLVLSIEQTKDNKVLLGTKDFGLFLLSSENLISSLTDTVVAHSIESTAAGESFSVNAIEIDLSENIWVTTQKGIFKYSSDLTGATRFTSAHGLHGDDFNSGSSVTTADGKLYFGGPRGYTSFHPDDIPMERQNSQFSLTSIKVTDRNGLTSLVSPLIDRLVLQHNHHSLTLTFAVHNFLDPWKSTYRYQMMNFDPQWTNSGRRGYATYNTLPPGEYKFIAKGYDSTGLAADPPISLKISVEASPYSSVWAISSYISIALFLLALATYMRQIYIQRENALEEAERHKRAISIVESEFIDLQENQDEILQEAHQSNIDLIKSLNSIYRGTPNGATSTFERSIVALKNSVPHYKFQGIRLVVDIRRYVDELLTQQVMKWFKRPESVTTINNVPDIQIEPKLALPIVISLYEFIHFFCSTAEASNFPAHYLEVNLALHTTDGNRIQLEVSHDGNTSPMEALQQVTRDTTDSLRAFFEEFGGEVDIQFFGESNLRVAKLSIDHIPAD